MSAHIAMILGLAISTAGANATLADPQGTPQLSLSRAFSAAANPATQWTTVIELLQAILGRAVVQPGDITRTGVAFEAPVGPGNVITAGPQSLGWSGYDLGRGLKEHLGLTEVLAESTWVAEAWAEYHHGSLNGCADWLYVSIGRSLECAVMSGGHFIRGAANNAGILGAVIIEREGALDSYGRRGTLDAYCGGHSFLSRARSYALTFAEPREIWKLAASNFAAQSVVEDYTARLAQGLAGAISLLNPQRLCMGGEFGLGIWDEVRGDLFLRLQDMAPTASVEKLQLVPSALGADAAAIGAVTLALHGRP